jgi:hypothetical protein
MYIKLVKFLIKVYRFFYLPNKYGHLKYVQEKIISDSISGKLKFLTFNKKTKICSTTYWICLNADIDAEIDIDNYGTSYAFLYIDKINYSYKNDFDLYRVIRSFNSKEDPGKTVLTLGQL